MVKGKIVLSVECASVNCSVRTDWLREHTDYNVQYLFDLGWGRIADGKTLLWWCPKCFPIIKGV